MPADLRKYGGAPGRIRTCDTRFRRAVLYPLSYEGGAWLEVSLQPSLQPSGPYDGQRSGGRHECGARVAVRAAGT